MLSEPAEQCLPSRSNKIFVEMYLFPSLDFVRGFPFASLCEGEGGGIIEGSGGGRSNYRLEEEETRRSSFGFRAEEKGRGGGLNKH